MPLRGRPGLILAVVLALIALIAFVTIASRVRAPSVSPSGPCVGGPATGSVGQPVGNGNYRFDCSGGGSTIVHLGNAGN
jgi:hypothetical protein